MEQKEMERQAKLEKDTARKDKLTKAVVGGKTLAGFDMETILRTNLLEIQLKVIRAILT
jgi:hypothetical protein